MESNNTLLSLPSFECSSTSDSKSGGFPEAEVKLASQNPKKKAGRKKFKETRHPVYRGVRSRNSGKWVCEVREPITQSRVWLGTYPTAEMAAIAHDVAVLAMRGPSACLNFADSVWRLPVPESSNIKDIQKTAADAAVTFRPSELVVETERNKEVPEYVDEEEMFETPRFLERMAEALMVPPPQMGYGQFMDNVEFSDDISLWSL